MSPEFTFLPRNWYFARIPRSLFVGVYFGSLSEREIRVYYDWGCECYCPMFGSHLFFFWIKLSLYFRMWMEAKIILLFICVCLLWLYLCHKSLFLFLFNYVYVHYYISNGPSLDVDGLMICQKLENPNKKNPMLNDFTPTKETKNMQKGLMTALWPWHVLDYWEI